jgi:hypothetical protein
MASDVIWAPGADPIDLLNEAIPEFAKELEDKDRTLPYVVFGFFAQYLQTLPSNDPIFGRAMEFLNGMAETGNVEFDNLLQIGVFESMIGNRRLSQRVKVRLRPDAMKLFLAAEGAANKF